MAWICYKFRLKGTSIGIKKLAFWSADDVHDGRKQQQQHGRRPIIPSPALARQIVVDGSSGRRSDPSQSIRLFENSTLQARQWCDRVESPASHRAQSHATLHVRQYIYYIDAHTHTHLHYIRLRAGCMPYEAMRSYKTLTSHYFFLRCQSIKHVQSTVGRRLASKKFVHIAQSVGYPL